MGILDQFTSIFKGAAKQTESSVKRVANEPGRKAKAAANQAKSKGKAVTQQPGRAMRQQVSRASSKVNQEINKADPTKRI